MCYYYKSQVVKFFTFLMIKCSISNLLSEIYQVLCPDKYLVIEKLAKLQQIQNGVFVLFSPILYNLHNTFFSRYDRTSIKCRWNDRVKCQYRYLFITWRWIVCVGRPAVDFPLKFDRHVHVDQVTIVVLISYMIQDNYSRR